MTEYHCWIALKCHSHDTHLYLQDECVRKCEAYLASYAYMDPSRYVVIHGNNQVTFLASALHNHRGGYIIDVFKTLGTLAPGSYGILHYNDNEVNMNADERFILYVMKKGKVSEEQDCFLSPRVPTIEDEYDETRD